MNIALPDLRRLPWLPLLVILAGWIFFFRDDAKLLEWAWESEDFSYTLLVPLVAGYMAWQDRNEILASCNDVRWPGIVGLAVSGVLLFTARLGSLETLTYLACWLSIVSITVLFLGTGALRRLLFPALILLFIVPPPPFIERTVSFQLRLISSSLAAQMLQLLSVPVYLEGNIIDLGVTKLQVVDACSGLRYLLPTILLSLITGYVMANNLVSRIILFLLSAPISLGLNSIRITITGLLVRYVSRSLADGFFHDFQGWVIYLAAIALLAGASIMLKRREKQPAKAEAATPDQPVASALSDQPGASGEATQAVAPAAEAAPSRCAAPSLVLTLGAAALLVLMSLGTASFISAQTVPSWKPLESFPLEIGPWRGVKVILDRETLDNIWCDDYFMGEFRKPGSDMSISILVPYYKAQTTQHTAHAPTSCFLGSGWEVTSKTQLPSAPERGRAFPVQQMVLEKAGGKLLSNFWFQQRGRIITSEYANKWYLFVDAVGRQRTDGALVRIEMVLQPGMSLEQGQAELDAFTGQVEELLRGYLPQ